MITVFRWGHRAVRDERITTHVCLVARAFGAEKVVVSGENAGETLSSVKKISSSWGGKFEIEYAKNWRKVLEEWDGKIVHLTMYGERIQDKIGEIREAGKSEPVGIRDEDKIREAGKNPGEGGLRETVGLRGKGDLLVIVGSQKVPGELYSRATWNIAVTSQPHSEVAALAIFLHEYFGGKELENDFPGAKVKIMPNPRGKSFEPEK